MTVATAPRVRRLPRPAGLFLGTVADEVGRGATMPM